MTNKPTKHDIAASKHAKALEWLRQRTAHAMEENEPLFPQVEAMLNKEAKPLNGKTNPTKRKLPDSFYRWRVYMEARTKKRLAELQKAAQELAE